MGETKENPIDPDFNADGSEEAAFKAGTVEEAPGSAEELVNERAKIYDIKTGKERPELPESPEHAIQVSEFEDEIKALRADLEEIHNRAILSKDIDRYLELEDLIVEQRQLSLKINELKKRRDKKGKLLSHFQIMAGGTRLDRLFTKVEKWAFGKAQYEEKQLAIQADMDKIDQQITELYEQRKDPQSKEKNSLMESLQERLPDYYVGPDFVYFRKMAEDLRTKVAEEHKKVPGIEETIEKMEAGLELLEAFKK